MSHDEEDPSNMSDSEEVFLRKLARKRVLRRTGIQIHGTSYVFVNVLLLIINYLTPPTYFWSLWAIVGWGAGLAFHGFAYFNPKGSGMSWHAFSFVIVNCLLFFIFVFTEATTYPWFLWPFGAWSVGLLSHFVVWKVRKPRNGEDASKSWIERKIDKELRKVSHSDDIPKKICTKCGTEDLEGATFCARCGNQL